MYTQDNFAFSKICAMTSDNFSEQEFSFLLSHVENKQIARLYIRSLAFPEAKLCAFLEAIPKHLRKQCMLHRLACLAHEYELLGCQFSEAQVKNGEHTTWKNTGLHLGASLHAREDLQNMHEEFHSFLFGPVFPSISTPGKLPRYTQTEIKSFPKHIQEKTLLLGGISQENMQEFQEQSFCGFVLRGALVE